MTPPAPLFCLSAMFTVQTGIALSTPLFPDLGVAGYILLTQRVGRAFEGFDGLALSLTVAALVLAPVGLGEGLHGLGRSPHPALLLLAVSGVALLFPVVPYLLEMVALRRLPER